MDDAIQAREQHHSTISEPGDAQATPMVPLSHFPPPMSPAPHDERHAVPIDEFISEERIRELVAGGYAHRVGVLLTTADGRCYALQEAVRVLGSVSSTRPGAKHGSDPYGFTGLVDTVVNLLRRGFVLSGARIALGRRAYDVEYGWLAQPVPGKSPDESGVNPRLP